MEVGRVRFLARGQVQGVGFRPYVYRLARNLKLDGHVSNDQDGAIIEVQGPQATVELFARRLLAELPPLAEVTELTRQWVALDSTAGFRIRPSRHDGHARARVTVDVTVCRKCLAEMRDRSDRRHRYPFINCTDCGPRYSIVQRIPYDRPNTTMEAFQMCPQCRSEYDDPMTRRFHAQPIACPACGPKVWLADAHGRPIKASDPIEQAVERLLGGQILAIKGLGGFHLACRADQDAPVADLRRRKRRDHKPFALMVRDLAAAEQLAHLGEHARKMMAGVERPIVLAPKRDGAPVSKRVAPGSDCFGLMLPYTPLHCLLFDADMPPLVMTSGNITDEPLAKDNDEAVTRLGPLCDAFLLHDRGIERRVDDSVVQVDGDRVGMMRRSRGYVPAPIGLGSAAPEEILAVGAELRNAICLVRGEQAVLSEHIGDLTDATVYRQFTRTIDHLTGLVEAAPSVVAHDLHPLYLSTRYARQQGWLRRIGVQHHFAHAVSCMVEHDLDRPVIAIVCDGTGYGTDGASWGCEILRAERGTFERVGHLQYFPLPGGDAASRELHRSVLGLLWHTFGPECAELALAATVCADPLLREGLLAMLRSQTNCPRSSSLGRLFDAVACMLGVAGTNEFEGQAPMALEAIAAGGYDDYYPHSIEHQGRSFELDVRPMISAIVAETQMHREPEVVSARFHNTVVELLKAGALIARDITELDEVVLSGGCFANRYVTRRLCERLGQVGMRVWTHRRVPCGDGGIALGQAAVAAAVLQEEEATAREVKHVSGGARTN
ncbi:MAG TPA: carbamoyltransferase HypF [Phycisphaerae bacterium]|nr:carbamoyltransferase HypF [Phycisphaerae bacterium]